VGQKEGRRAGGNGLRRGGKEEGGLRQRGGDKEKGRRWRGKGGGEGEGQGKGERVRTKAGGREGGWEQVEFRERARNRVHRQWARWYRC